MSHDGRDRKRKRIHEEKQEDDNRQQNDKSMDILSVNLSLSLGPSPPPPQELTPPTTPPPPPPQEHNSLSLAPPPPPLPNMIQPLIYVLQPVPQPPLLPLNPPSPQPPVPAVRRAPPNNPAGQLGNPVRPRRNSTRNLRPGKSPIVPAPFAWATTRRATVHTLEYLITRKITTITGDVECKQCEQNYQLEFNLMEMFNKVAMFIAKNRDALVDRAPDAWKNPVFPTCTICQQNNSARPIIDPKKKRINWLFLFLGEMLGCCTLKQLKYFCKHTSNHRTGAKDRILYLTYLGLCKQMYPTGPFNPLDR